MSTLLNLKTNPHKTFRKHFLAGVYCEIRFIELDIQPVLFNKDRLKEIFAKFGFDSCKEIFSGEATFSTEGDSPKLMQQISPCGLAFISEQPKRELQIRSTSLIFSDFKYSKFDDFLENIKKCTNEIITLLNLESNSKELINKIGLRKIDSIIIEPVSSIETALNIFNPSLFNLAKSDFYIIEALKGMEEVLVLERDSNTCILRARLNRKNNETLEANLDFDLVSHANTSINNAFEKILPSLNQMHFDLFMWAISENMVKLMEGDYVNS